MIRRYRVNWLLMLAATLGPVTFASTRVGPWNGANFAAPTTEPGDQASFIVDNNGARIFDDQLAADFFTNPNTDFTNYQSMLFTFEACHSGGFIDNLALLDGNEANINVAADQRPGIVVSTACAWNECSFFTPGTAANNFTDAFSYYPHFFQDAVANNGAADVGMLSAFQSASQAVVNQGNGQDPQYYGVNNNLNNFTYRFLPNIPDYAFLFAVGGINNVGWEFFNDIQRERNILINNYGWNAANIITMYGSGPGGTLPDGVTAVPNWVNFAATNAGLLAALGSVHNNSAALTKIIWFSSSHGDSLVVPEPGALVLTGVAFVFLMLRRRAN